MRLGALLLLTLIFAAAQAPAPDARAAYAERRALLEADTRCRLFAPATRSALEAGLSQAAGALLRSGWSMARLRELDGAASQAARNRNCDDPQTQAAVRRAQAGFAAFARAHAMTFAGASRAWFARRTPDPQGGWMLSQALPGGARFGVRARNHTEELALFVPAQARGGVQLLLRDPARAPQSQMDVPGRHGSGLTAGLPAPSARRAFQPHAQLNEGSGQAFLFDPEALGIMLSLDPRETASLAFADGRAPLLIEIGDLAAARAFLLARNPA